MKKFISRKRIRLKNYDYSLNGYYFVTVCLNNRNNIFGEHNKSVGEGLASSRNVSSRFNPRNKIQLSTIGQIIDNHLKIHFHMVKWECIKSA